MTPNAADSTGGLGGRKRRRWPLPKLPVWKIKAAPQCGASRRRPRPSPALAGRPDMGWRAALAATANHSSPAPGPVRRLPEKATPVSPVFPVVLPVIAPVFPVVLPVIAAVSTVLAPVLNPADQARPVTPVSEQRHLTPPFLPHQRRGRSWLRPAANPFYAINIDEGLAVPHEPLISEDDWVKANIRLIE